MNSCLRLCFSRCCTNNYWRVWDNISYWHVTGSPHSGHHWHWQCRFVNRNHRQYNSAAYVTLYYRWRWHKLYVESSVPFFHRLTFYFTFSCFGYIKFKILIEYGFMIKGTTVELSFFAHKNKHVTYISEKKPLKNILVFCWNIWNIRTSLGVYSSFLFRNISSVILSLQLLLIVGLHSQPELTRWKLLSATHVWLQPRLQSLLS